LKSYSTYLDIIGVKSLNAPVSIIAVILFTRAISHILSLRCHDSAAFWILYEAYAPFRCLLASHSAHATILSRLVVRQLLCAAFEALNLNDVRGAGIDGTQLLEDLQHKRWLDLIITF
jgi:hypothetical protein